MQLIIYILGIILFGFLSLRATTKSAKKKYFINFVGFLLVTLSLPIKIEWISLTIHAIGVIGIAVNMIYWVGVEKSTTNRN